MNGLEIATIIIAGVCLWVGYRQGLFRTLLLTIAMVLAIGLSSYACPYVSNALQKYTAIDDKIEAYIIEQWSLDITKQDTTKTEQMQMIDELPFPERIKTAIISNNDNDANGIYGGLQVGNFQEYLAKYLTCMMMNALSFLVIQVAITVGLVVLLCVTKVLTEIPILHGIDKAGGICLGAAVALIIIWTGFLFISILGNTQAGVWAFSKINESPVLDFLFSHNLLLDVATNISRMIF